MVDSLGDRVLDLLEESILFGVDGEEDKYELSAGLCGLYEEGKRSFKDPSVESKNYRT
jgi:hypothetical protein